MSPRAAAGKRKEEIVVLTATYLITSDAAHAENIISTHGLSRTGGNAVTTENRARSRPTTFCDTRKHLNIRRQKGEDSS